MATWNDVAQAVKARRYQLEISQRKAAAGAGISTTTWNRLEVQALPVDDMTRLAVARVLRWPSDAIDRVLGGVDPAEISAEGDDFYRNPISSHREVLAELGNHSSPEVLAAAIVELVGMFERLEERIQRLEASPLLDAWVPTEPAQFASAADTGAGGKVIRDMGTSRRRVGPAEGE